MIETPWLVGDAHPLGIFENYNTLNNPRAVQFDPISQHYLINMSSVGNVFLWKHLEGDFLLHARVHVGEAAENAVWGLIVCSGITANTIITGNSIGVGLVVDNGDVQLQAQGEEKALPLGVQNDSTHNNILQLERKGSTFIVKVAPMGKPFGATTTTEVALNGVIYIGLFVAGAPTNVRFDNVRVVVPAQPDQTMRDRPLGSYLEVLELATGTRQIIHSSATPFEAPNWTPDGKALIYNSQGRLYRFDLATGDVSEIDTGFATRNNNDHVLSFDGSMIAISDHTEEGHSIVYTVPVGGGTPRRVTARGPSYLHGWSPDGKYLVYTGARDGEYDIYRIGVDGGPETRLTTAPGLDDGPEYTPDGWYIYFNSVRSGTMQIWRMKPDGSDQEQITDDEFNNWFAHISPDGQEFVFLSYLPDVDPSAHPPYKHVYLRRMLLEGGEPDVIAYVYGGQGTINVPSWSPDGKHLAFVSNTAME